MSPPDGYLNRYTALGKRGKLNFIRHRDSQEITITRSTTIGNQYYSLEQNYPVADTKALAVFGTPVRIESLSVPSPTPPYLFY